jgi:DNA (cytosine-5)-methyltransferase 1
LDTTFGSKQGLENQHVNAGCPMFVPAVANTLGASPSCHSSVNVASGQGDVIAFDVFNQDLTRAVSKTVASRNDQDTASCVAVEQPIIVHGTQDPCVSDIAFAQGRNNGGENVMVQLMAVRRLTPTECERLQGFPDGYTDIKHGGKSTPDGPRYKALGNSMAVPVMAWIGQRIQQVENIV